LPAIAGGHKAYGVYVTPGVGYRNLAAKGMARLAKDTPAAIRTVATIILLAAGCGGGNAEDVSDGGGQDASVAIDSRETMGDGAGAIESGVRESGGGSGGAGSHDAGGSSDSGSEGSTSYPLNRNAFTYSFPPNSFTVLRLE
jgi:hypothetical protein